MTNEQVRRAVRRAGAQARAAPHAARDGPRGLGPGDHRGGRCSSSRAAWRRRPARRICAWPAASRSTAWPTASCCARKSSTGCGCSRRRATPAARWARPMSHYHHVRNRQEPAPQHGMDAMRGGYLGPQFTPGRHREAPARRRAVFEVLKTPKLIEAVRQGARRGQGARLASRAAWSSARARSAARSILGDARSPAMQKTAQPQGQVPRVVPPVRALGARRGRRRSGSTSTARAHTCCWSPTCSSGIASR